MAKKLDDIKKIGVKERAKKIFNTIFEDDKFKTILLDSFNFWIRFKYNDTNRSKADVTNIAQTYLAFYLSQILSDDKSIEFINDDYADIANISTTTAHNSSNKLKNYGLVLGNSTICQQPLEAIIQTYIEGYPKYLDSVTDLKTKLIEKISETKSERIGITQYYPEYPIKDILNELENTIEHGNRKSIPYIKILDSKLIVSNYIIDYIYKNNFIRGNKIVIFYGEMTIICGIQPDSNVITKSKEIHKAFKKTGGFFKIMKLDDAQTISKLLISNMLINDSDLSNFKSITITDYNMEKNLVEATIRYAHKFNEGFDKFFNEILEVSKEEIL